MLKSTIKQLLAICLPILVHFASLGQTTYLDSLLKEVKQTRSSKTKAYLYNEISWEIAPIDPEKALNYAQKALALSKGRSEEEEATSYNRIGGAYDMAGKYEQAIQNYSKCAALRLDLGDTIGYSNALINVGAAYYVSGSFSKALEFYQKAASAKEKIGDRKGLSQAYNNIGLIYRVQKKYDKAIQTFKKTLKVKNELGDVLGQTNVLSNMGVIYLNQGNCEKAISFFMDAHEVVIDNKLVNEEGATYSNLGLGYKCAGDYTRAMGYFKQAEKVLLKVNDQSTYAFCLKGLAEVHYERKNFNEAINTLDKALELALQVGRRELVSEIYLLKSKCYKSLNQFESALINFENYQVYHDSLFSSESSRQLNEIETIYETNKNQEEIKRLNHVSDIQKKEAKAKRLERNWFISLFIGSLLILLLLLHFFYQKNKVNKALNSKNDIIEKALNEKEILLREIHHRVKNNLQIITGLLELQLDYSKDEAMALMMDDAKGRIKSMALIHEMLYQSKDLDQINLQQYMEKLVGNVEQGFSKAVNLPSKHIDIDANCHLNIDTIIPLGLIVNELLTNAYKYAFGKKEENRLILRIAPEDATGWKLTVADNGPGIPHDLNGDSFGLRMVKMLSRQLNGKMTIENHNGATFIVTFKELNKL